MTLDLVKSNVYGFNKDRNTGAVINTDTSGYEAVKVERQRVKEIKQIQADIESIHADLKEIRQLIQQICKCHAQ